MLGPAGVRAKNIWDESDLGAILLVYRTNVVGDSDSYSGVSPKREIFRSVSICCGIFRSARTARAARRPGMPVTHPPDEFRTAQVQPCERRADVEAVFEDLTRQQLAVEDVSACDADARFDVRGREHIPGFDDSRFGSSARASRRYCALRLPFAPASSVPRSRRDNTVRRSRGCVFPGAPATNPSASA